MAETGEPMEAPMDQSVRLRAQTDSRDEELNPYVAERRVLRALRDHRAVLVRHLHWFGPETDGDPTG